MQRRLETLEEAFTRQDKDARAERIRLWEEIQVRTPELAEFMTGLKNTFGKLSFVSVEFLGRK